jgi:general secretion pathway protein N
LVAEVPLNVVVTSIVLTAERQIAIVTDPESKRSQTLSVGSALEGDQSAWRLVELQPRAAVFEGPGGRSAVDLRVFDGQGGEPPTPVAQVPVAQAQAPRPGGGETGAQKQDEEGRPQGAVVVEADSPEARAEQIRRRIEERRRQMREEAERANAERGQ